MHGFYGWYLKCQSETQTLAVIPAIHRGNQKSSCSIQIITEENNWNLEFPADIFRKKGRSLIIGDNKFDENGICLNLDTAELKITGELEFGPLFALKYDIMGPFRFLPFMECRHMIWSMWHSVRGNISVNGEDYLFENDWGYWEGDQGRSFPKEYLWTQCFFRGGSLMLAVADIPLGRFHFSGIIGVVLWMGREYRLATYLGARVVQIEKGVVQIMQGNLELEVQLLEAGECSLRAPESGNMKRTIHENLSGWAVYQFRENGQILFAFETERASFEYEYPV